jgi:hypothetical protein
MNPNQEIRNQFANIQEKKEEVRLINDHRGIPINYEAMVEGFDEQGVIFRVNKYQCVCLELDRYTYIQSPSLHSIVKGRVVDLDIVTSQVKLSAFEYAAESIGKRNTVRVQPKEPMDVLLLYHGEKIRGRLADISSSGMGVFVMATYIYNPGLLRKGEQIQVVVKLPNDKGSAVNEVHLTGTILYLNRDKGSYRLGVNMIVDAYAKTQIAQFVSNRQAEILRELRMLYDTFYRLRIESRQKSNPA